MFISEIITEIFQPGMKNWEWKFRGSEEAIAEFEVGGRTYMWSAYSHVRIKNPEKWEVQFRLLRQDSDPEDLDLFGTTGTGNSAQVMSTAVDITRDFLKTYGDKVLELTFSKNPVPVSDICVLPNKLDMPNYHKKSEVIINFKK